MTAAPADAADAAALRLGQGLPAALGRLAAGATALACAAAGLWLAAHHPLSATLALALFGATALALARWPQAWPVLLPALLPWIALAPWSGWITVEETDLLVLAVAAGGHARWAWRPWPVDRRGAARRLLAWLLLGLWTASVLVALQRGVADAGGLAFAWDQAYRGPMNALRLAKPTLAVWLLLPLWLRLQDRPGAAAGERLTLGLALAHGGTALACLYERLAYTGLLNFSTDYRTTGLFWEMHVGGAGLDAVLAMTLPFAWRFWLTARSRAGSVLALAIVLLGSYALLTTFSRILLLALPLCALTLALLQRGSPRPAMAGRPLPVAASAAQLRTVAALGAGIAAAAAWMFASSGYRGLLGLLGCAALLLALAPQVGRLARRDWLGALALALALGPAWLLGATLLDKGPYLAFGLVLAAAWFAVLGSRGRSLPLALGLAGYWIALASLAGVAWHWGGARALAHAWPVAAALALLLPALAHWRPAPWPASLRWQAGALAALGLAAMVVGLFGGGAYMSGRISASDGDQQGRVQHWRAALARIPDGAPRWLGVGLGRFLDHYAIDAAAGTRPGDIRLVDADGAPAMRLVAGTHVQGWGELLRLSQRIARPQGPVTLRATLRGAAGAGLHAEVCIKHLLYDATCVLGQTRLPAAASGWITVTLALQGALPADARALPRVTTFSVGTETAQPLELRALSLTDAAGTELLVNGRWRDGGARWFFSSDRYHMPWHAKNMAVHLLFEQGWLGLGALALLTAAALGVALTRARQLPLAPALAAALVGAWTVGLVDSVLDMPRVALLLLLLTLVAIVQAPARSR